MTAAEQAPGANPAPEAADPYRILIVEDDRSQALFAQTVLQAAGMRSLCVAEAGEVIGTLAEFVPDLVLMDLHLPGISGTELTAAIRAMPEHAHVPILLLTADPDPEMEYRALDSGADDFLAKPIRPRHLIAAIRNRVERARRLRSAHGADMRDPLTGLQRRDRLLPRLAQAPGALLVEVQHLAALQQQLGYTGTEVALRQLGKRLAGLAPDAARVRDAGFLVLAGHGDEASLAALARQLRDALAQPIPSDGLPLRLRVAIGYLPANAAGEDRLDALERALRQAREAAAGIAGFQHEVQAADAGDADILREALRDDGFELAFQPIVAVAGNDDAQFQVLVRLREGGTLAAGTLIARAEAAQLLGDIDRWVLERALDQLAADDGPSRLFVSQSPQAIAADPHGAWLQQAMASRAIAAEALVLDLRLDDALVHTLALAEFCERLVPHGVRFCLAQYVHGEEAAALLRRLPLAYVRLAPRYSQDHANPALRDALGALVHEAHGAGLRVIGAQVESPAAAAMLWMSGIDYIQGNLVQRAGAGLDFDFHHSVL